MIARRYIYDEIERLEKTKNKNRKLMNNGMYKIFRTRIMAFFQEGC